MQLNLAIHIHVHIQCRVVRMYVCVCSSIQPYVLYNEVLRFEGYPQSIQFHCRDCTLEQVAREIVSPQVCHLIRECFSPKQAHNLLHQE